MKWIKLNETHHSVFEAFDVNAVGQARPQKLNFFSQKFYEILRIGRLEQRQLELVLQRRRLEHRKLWKKIDRVGLKLKRNF